MSALLELLAERSSTPKSSANHTTPLEGEGFAGLSFSKSSSSNHISSTSDTGSPHRDHRSNQSCRTVEVSVMNAKSSTATPIEETDHLLPLRETHDMVPHPVSLKAALVHSSSSESKSKWNSIQPGNRAVGSTSNDNNASLSRRRATGGLRAPMINQPSLTKSTRRAWTPSRLFEVLSQRKSRNTT
jgi:hypothetical protein